MCSISKWALILVVCLVPSLSLAGERCHAPDVTALYDLEIKRSARRHLPFWYDWCWLKAQLAAHGRLEEDGVRNQRRVIGEVSRHHGLMLEPWLTARRAHVCQVNLALASSFVGVDQVLAGQIASFGAECWNGIASAMDGVVGTAKTVQMLLSIQSVWDMHETLSREPPGSRRGMVRW